MKTPTLFLALTLFVGTLFADEFAPLFPFVITKFRLFVSFVLK